MSTAKDERDVVVAVDGSEAAYAVIRFAVAEATRLGTGLEIVNVIPGHLSPTGRAPVDSSLRRYAHTVLERAEAYARTVGGPLHVHTRLHEGHRVSALADCSEDAALMVLGCDHAAVAGHVWTGSTVVGVCARAACPVVVVPSTWTGQDRLRRVVAGFKTPEHAAELLADAFAMADDQGAELLLLHAWKLQGAYDDIVSERVGKQQWELQVLAEMESLIADLRTDHPQVVVRLDVRHDQPAHALVEVSASADRLLIARPAHGSFVHHLGGTARAVLREARCPVHVVPAVVGGADTHGLAVEAAGELVR